MPRSPREMVDFRAAIMLDSKYMHSHDAEVDKWDKLLAQADPATFDMYFATPDFAEAFDEIQDGWDRSDVDKLLREVTAKWGSYGFICVGFDIRKPPVIRLPIDVRDKNDTEILEAMRDLAKTEQAFVPNIVTYMDMPGGRFLVSPIEGVVIVWGAGADGQVFLYNLVLTAQAFGTMWASTLPGFLSEDIALILWLLSNPDLMDEVQTTTLAGLPPAAKPRDKKERAARDQPIKVISLRKKRKVYIPREDVGNAEREFHHQWKVSGHMRKQRVGPGRTEIREVWVSEYTKGPKDAPMLEKQTVKKW